MQSGKKKTESLRPVTILQVHQASSTPGEDKFRIDGHDVGTVTFVGQIIKIAQRETNNSFEIDDGTGTIEVKVWTTTEDAEDEASKAPKYTERSYVRVFGSLKVYREKKTINATAVRVVEDFNEITYHMLESLSIHLFYLHGPAPNSGALPGSSSSSSSSSAVKSEVKSEGAQDYADTTGLVFEDPVFNSIYQAVRSVRSQKGCSFVEIKRRLQADSIIIQDDNDLREYIEQLVNASHLYVTSDDNHWGICE